MEGKFVKKKKKVVLFFFFFLHLLEQFLMHLKNCFPFNKATVKYLQYSYSFITGILTLRVGTTSSPRISPCALENSWLSYLTGTERLHIHKTAQQEPYFVQMCTIFLGEICTSIPHYS